MSTALARNRARSDVDILSRAGLPLDRFMEEAVETVRRAVPFVAACLSTLDPSTALVSSTRKVGALAGRNDDDIAWAQIEYGGQDPTSMIEMILTGRTAVGVRHETAGDVERSVRMAELIVPRFGFRDEARVVFTDRGGAWGGISMFRGSDDRPFSLDELVFLASVAASFTRGIQAGLLTQLDRSEGLREPGPAVVIVDVRDRIVQSSPGAAAQLARIADAPNAGDPMLHIQALVSDARRVARGESDRVPRIRIRTVDGVWLVLHAATLGGSSERAGDVVVAIEEARPQEVVDIVAAAFGLTARERDVVGMVLRGADTREIATGIGVSPYTVQDHLKSIFQKAGVTSRRELVSRVYFDQYAPRAGRELGANGWFAA